MTRRLTILIYCQHLSGTGHFVRSLEIARALAAAHDVHLVDGGRCVPHVADARVRMLELPRICRDDGQLRAIDSDTPIDHVMRARAQLLREAVERLRPDVLIVEHFPFSKWELAGEIVPLIEGVRQANAGARVVCSRRDIIPPSRYDGDPQAHGERVVAALHAHFDAVMVHGDRDLSRIEDEAAWWSQVRIPLYDTGYVAPELDESGDDVARDQVLVSSGGAGDATLAQCAVEAWRQMPPAERGQRRMIVFAPPFARVDEVSLLQLRVAAGVAGVEVRAFEPAFAQRLPHAALSISHAGYNTCANLLRARCPAVLVPHAPMPDQEVRSRLLAARGLAHVVSSDELTPARLAEAMRAALASPPIIHDIRLDGARRTRAVIESFSGACAAGATTATAPPSALDLVRQVVKQRWTDLQAATWNDEHAESLAAYAAHHHVSHYLLGRLETVKRLSLLPPRCVKLLREEVVRRADRAANIPEVLAEVTAALTGAGIEHRVLKGLPFAARFFGDVNLRRQVDVDLLVRPQQADAALRVLWDRGFRTRPRRVQQRPDGLVIHPHLRRTEHALALGRDRIPVDLHWRLRNAPAYQLNEDEIWARPRQIDLGGASYAALNDEYALVLLLLSTAHDIGRGGCKLKHLLDIHRMLATIGADIDWPAFFERRAAEGIDGICAAMLAITLDVLDTRTDHAALAAFCQAWRPPDGIDTPQAAVALVHGKPGSVANAMWLLKVYPVCWRRDAMWWLDRHLSHPGRAFVAAYRSCRFALRWGVYMLRSRA